MRGTPNDPDGIFAAINQLRASGRKIDSEDAVGILIGVEARLVARAENSYAAACEIERECDRMRESLRMLDLARAVLDIIAEQDAIEAQAKRLAAQ